MFGTTFSHRTLRKYVVLFGTLFNNIYLTRQNSSGATIQTMKVPLSYGPKEKFLARVEGNPDLNRKIAITLPRISFEMVAFQYDPDRKRNTLNKLQTSGDGRRGYQYNPVPYNIQFQLSVMVKNAEDGTRIIEQILPYFTPDWTASVYLVPELNTPFDIPIILNDVSCEDTYQGNFDTRRAIVWTLNFTMKCWLFGPTKLPRAGGDAPIIKFAEVYTRPTTNVDTANTTNTAETLKVTAQPGLTANGEPTTDITLTIDYNLINADDNYDFINEFTENT